MGITLSWYSPFSVVRYGTAILFGVLWYLVFASPASAQEEAITVDNRIQVKLTESAKAQLIGAKEGLPKAMPQGRTGLQALDQMAQQFQVERMERIFRPAGKHESRHVKWGLDRWYTIHFRANVNPRAVARSYLESSTIESSSPVYEKAKTVLDEIPDWVDDGDESGTPGEERSDEEPSFVPNDPDYSAQWHYENTSDNPGTPGADIDLADAHSIEAGDSTVVVSVVDGGLDLDHPEFEGMLWINKEEDINDNGQFDPTPASEGGDLNGVDDDNNGYVDDVIGYDHANGDPVPDASGDHGTHVAGTVAAKNDNGQWGSGVAGGGNGDSGIRLMINKTFSSTGGGGFAEAIVYCADNGGCTVSQNSWGYSEQGAFEQPVLDAIDYLRANAGGPGGVMDGGIFVNAAGNSGSKGEWYPGYYSPSYAVSATNEFDDKASYSNYGAWVDIAAPGGNVDGCQGDPSGVLSTTDGGFGPLCGTSMAAPHVSGVIGLVVSHNPGMTNDQVEALLQVTGEDVNSNFRIGRRVNAFNAVTAGVDTTAPAPIDDLSIVSVNKGTSGGQATLEWTAPGDDGDTTGSAATYALRYSTQGPIQNEADWVDATPLEGEPDPDTVGTTQRVAIPDTLPFGETVYFALRATDELDNTSPLGNSPGATVPIELVQTVPAAHAASVDTSARLTLTFSQTVDPATIGPDSIIVVGGRTGRIVEADGQVSVSGDQVVYDPAHPFRPGEHVRVSVLSGVASTDGVSLGTTETFEFIVGSVSAPGTFPRRVTIADSAEGVRDAHVADIDGDGTLDAVWGSRVPADNEGRIVWHTNGNGTYGGGAVIASGIPQIADLHPADIDGDGDMDIVSASLEPAWYENTAGDGSNWTEHSMDTGSPVPADAHVTDIDGDGDGDVLFAAGTGSVLWIENDTGAGDSWTLHSIVSDAAQPVSVDAGDVDGDGDPDVFAAHNATESGDKIAWYENRGEGTFGPHQTITTDVATPTDVHAADVDRDGRLDVLSASNNDSKVAWYPNTEEGGFGAQQVVNTGARPQTLRAPDIDGDGDLDVLSVDQNEDRIVWYENSGTGDFADPHVVTNTVTRPQAVAAGDTDGDGDLDVFSASPGGATVAWYENARANALPMAEADEYQVGTDSTLTVSAPGVLGNDTDPDGDSLTASLADSTADGALTLSADGSFEYVPDAGFAGTDRFAYEAADAGGAADTAAVTIQVGTSLTRSISLVTGWNLVSIPLGAEDTRFSTVLPSCENGFFFRPGEGYQSIAEEESVPPGRGFFANCSADTATITGAVPDSQTVAVETGWNIVGPFADSVDVEAISTEPSGIVQTSFFGFDPSSGYTSASVLVPSGGYWVKVRESGTLDLSGASGGAALAATTALRTEETESAAQAPDGVRLLLTDAKGRSATLRFVPDATKRLLRRSALPPVPPDETFDVRFASGRSMVGVDPETNELHRIETQGLAAPVEIKMKGASTGQRLRLHHGTGSDATETRLSRENPTVTLPGTARLEAGFQRVPAEFALWKSAPNPVRRQARIEYAVPKETDVTIAVYDVLGRSVARLVEGPRRAGRYSVTLEASRLPSGTYFYRMQAGSVTKTRRVTVVR